MKTGYVVNNFDPTYKGRCQIRIIGEHTEMIDNQYVILDDDLPWAKPAPQTTSTGSISVPDVGSRVYVDSIDRYTYIYYGQVEPNDNVKKLLHENTENSDKVKVLAMSEDADNPDNYIKMYYIPNKGFFLESDGNVVNLTKDNGIVIKTKKGSKIEMDSHDNLNIDVKGDVKLNCKNVELTKDASYRAVLGEKLMEKFNTHTHVSPVGPTTQPMIQLTVTDLSRNVKLK